ncbi:hypothetical protein BDR26DRAFT_227813 [Obelidium mucronatum]|nr:hypothetical protein BDR26DRAFT_227813 [Obelidium mucronatum]
MYRYTKSGGVYSIAAPTSGFGGLNTQIAAVTNSNGDKYLFSINSGGEVTESHYDTPSWIIPPALLSGGGGGGATRISAARDDEGNMMVWTVGSEGLNYCYLSTLATECTWRSASQLTDFADVYAFQGLPGEIAAIVLTMDGNLYLAGKLTTAIATNVKKAAAITDVKSNNLAFYSNFQNEVKYVMRKRNGSGSWDPPVSIDGKLASEVSVLLRSDGLWHLFIVEFGTGSIYHTRQHKILVDQNCLSGRSNQKACTTSTTSTSSEIPTSSDTSTQTSSSTTSPSESTTETSSTTESTTETSSTTESTTETSSTTESTTETSSTTESTTETSSTTESTTETSSTTESTTETEFDFNGNNGINNLLTSSSSISGSESTSFTLSTSTPTTTAGTATKSSSSVIPTTTSGPNQDCLTIKASFPTVQFNIDCNNVSPNGTYPVSKADVRRRQLARRMTSTFIQFESNRIIHVILPRMQLAGSISPLLGNLEQMKIL